MTIFSFRNLTACAGLAFCLLLAVPQAHGRGVFSQTGTASWYGEWHHGKVTANGESFDMFAMTAAHKTLPLGTLVKVTRRDSGQSIVVRINDRGPYVKRRIIDLSFAAAESLGMEEKGVLRVTIEVVGDRAGLPLAADQRFFVRLPDDGATVERRLSRLIRLGIHDAAALLHSGEGVMAIGPFSTFEESQKALTRVATTHPGASIMLAEKDSMTRALKPLAQR